MDWILWLIVAIVACIVFALWRQQQSTLRLRGHIICPDVTQLPDQSAFRVTFVDLTDGNDLRPIATYQRSFERAHFDLKFDLGVPHTMILADRVYGLWVEILLDKAVLYNSVLAHPIDLNAAEKLALPVWPARYTEIAALPSLHNVLPEDLAETHWTVRAISGQAVSAVPSPMLRISSKGQLFGHTGCNEFFAEVRFDGTKVTLAEATVGTNRGHPTIEVQQAAFLSALSNIASFEREEENLILVAANSEPLLELHPEVALPSTTLH